MGELNHPPVVSDAPLRLRRLRLRQLLRFFAGTLAVTAARLSCNFSRVIVCNFFARSATLICGATHSA
jgi:hypothetical protein